MKLLTIIYWHGHIGKKALKNAFFKREGESLFYKVAQDIGQHPAVLYSLSKILNDIGSNFMKMVFLG